MELQYSRCPSLSLQAKDVLHVIDSRLLVHNPLRSAKGAAGQDGTVTCLVSEFDAFAQSGKHDRMVTYDIATAKSVDTDLG